MGQNIRKLVILIKVYYIKSLSSKYLYYFIDRHFILVILEDGI